MEQKNDKQHLENVWRKQAKFMDNPAKSYGGFQKNDRRQTMIFYSDLYFNSRIYHSVCTGKLNKEGEMTEEVGVAQKEIRYQTNVIF
jgi:hypothetical protein